MNCLHCKEAVPLVQSLVQRGVPFCGDAHRKAYHSETQRLMLARLLETLPRYSKVTPIEVTPVFYPAPLSKEERTTAMAIRSFAVS
jgi:hypothetical protein